VSTKFGAKWNKKKEDRTEHSTHSNNRVYPSPTQMQLFRLCYMEEKIKHVKLIQLNQLKSKTFS